MPRVDIPVTEVDISGVAQPSQTTADATNDHSITGGADGRTIIEIVSSDAGSQTVEIVPNPSLFVADGLTINNLSITVAAGATSYAGPFRTSTYKQDTDNTLYLNPSVSTTLKFRAYRAPTP